MSPRDCDWIDTRVLWASEQVRHASELAEVLRTDLGLQPELVLDGIGLDVGGERLVSFLVARRLAQRGADHAPQWKAYRRQISSGLLAVMRLDAANRAIEDYVLLPPPLRAGRYVWLSSDSLRQHRGALYAGKDALFGAIKEKLARSIRGVSTRSVPPNKRKKPGLPKTKGSGARRRQCGDRESLR